MLQAEELQLHVKIPSIMEMASHVHEFVRMERIRIVILRIINYQLQMVHVFFSFSKNGLIKMYLRK